jgi:tetrahydromethanopterin S-methyltransferase subunit G
MAEPENMILPLLREMRAAMDRRFEGITSDMQKGFNAVDHRFDGLEKKIESVKQAAFGESVLGRYAAAEVEERLEVIEKRLSALERTKPAGGKKSR